VKRIYTKAIKLAGQEKYDEALPLLHNLINQNSVIDPYIHSEYVYYTYLNRCVDEARAYYFGPDAHNISIGPLLLGRALVEYYSDNPWRALGEIGFARKHKVDEHLLCYFESKIWAEYDRPQNAIVLLGKCRKATNLRWSVLYDLIELETDNKKLEELSLLCSRMAVEKCSVDTAYRESKCRAYAILWLAERWLQAGRVSKLRRLIKVLEELSSPIGKLCLATLLAELGEYNRAAKLFRSATKRDGWYKNVWRFTDIAKAIEATSEAFPNNLILRCRLTECLALQEKYEDGIEMVQQVLAHDAKHAEANQILLGLLAATERLDEWIEHLFAWTSANPQDEESHRMLFDALHNKDDFVRADKLLRKCRRRWPHSSWPIVRRGLLQKENQGPKPALRSFARAAKLDSKEVCLYIGFAEASAQIGDYGQALEQYDHALDLIPQNRAVCHNLLICARMVKDKVTGYKAFMRFMALGGHKSAKEVSAENVSFVVSFVDDYHENGLFYYYLSLCLLYEKKYDEAFSIIGQAIEVCDDCPDAYVLQGLLYGFTSQLDKAKESFQIAISLDPFHADALNYLGRHLDFEKNYSEAAEFFSKCAELKPDDKEAYNSAVKAAEKAGIASVIKTRLGKNRNAISIKLPETVTTFADEESLGLWNDHQEIIVETAQQLVDNFGDGIHGIAFSVRDSTQTHNDDTSDNSKTTKPDRRDKDTPSDSQEIRKIPSLLVLSDNLNEGQNEQLLFRTQLIEKARSSLPENWNIELLHLQGVWDKCLKNNYSILKEVSGAVHIVDDGSLSRIAALWLHKDRVLAKFEHYVVVYALGGSWIRGQATQESDIDLYIVIDDTDLAKMTRTELKDKLRGVFSEQLQDLQKEKKTNIPFNFQTYILTDFWDGLRDCNPILYTFVRDGVPFYDRGLFAPWKVLLNTGKIRPSPRAIDLYFEEAEKQLRRARENLIDVAQENLYYATVTSTQAILMAVGCPPPAPKELNDIACEILTDRYRLIPRDIFCTLERTIALRKSLEYKRREVPNPDELVGLLSDCAEYVRAIDNARSRAQVIGKINNALSVLPEGEQCLANSEQWLKRFSLAFT